MRFICRSLAVIHLDFGFKNTEPLHKVIVFIKFLFLLVEFLFELVEPIQYQCQLFVMFLIYLCHRCFVLLSCYDKRDYRT